MVKAGEYTVVLPLFILISPIVKDGCFLCGQMFYFDYGIENYGSLLLKIMGILYFATAIYIFRNVCFSKSGCSLSPSPLRGRGSTDATAYQL